LTVELAMKEDREPEVEQLWPVLRLEMATALNTAQAWLAQEQHAQASASASQDDYHESLSSLRMALEEQNMSACDLYLSLRPALQAVLPKADLDRLDQAMNTLQFDQALAITASLAVQNGAGMRSPA
jgi:hypothetical protein